MQGSFIKKAGNNKRLYIVRGVEKDGRKAWYYVEIEAQKEPIFRKKCAMENYYYDLNEHGKIIVSGWGENPPEEIKQKMENGE